MTLGKLASMSRLGKPQNAKDTFQLFTAMIK